MKQIPTIPDVVRVSPLQHVSASAAWLLLRCPLQVVFDTEPTLRCLRPHKSSALLGTAAHIAVASLARAQGLSRSGTSAPTQEVAGKIFDAALHAECDRRDRDVRERGEVPGDALDPPAKLPYCALTRARVKRFAKARFGAEWKWSEPHLTPHTSRRRVDQPALPQGNEVALASHDGRLRGSADSVRISPVGPEIEELKSGELTPERIVAWKFQLLLYGWLYHSSVGTPPSVLRIVSIHGDMTEFPYCETEAAAAAERAVAALLEVNAQIRQKASAARIGRPSEEVCRFCDHRPWCDSYWIDRPAGDSDIEGTVQSATGWKATIREGKRSVEIDFKPFGTIPQLGDRLRICGMRETTNGTVADRSTAVWRVPR